MADITQIDMFLKVLHTPHGWRSLRVIACMLPQPWSLTRFNSDHFNQEDWRSFLLEDDRAVAPNF